MALIDICNRWYYSKKHLHIVSLTTFYLVPIAQVYKHAGRSLEGTRYFNILVVVYIRKLLVLVTHTTFYSSFLCKFVFFQIQSKA